MSALPKELHERLCAADQEHVLDYLEGLEGPARDALIQQLEGLDYGLLGELALLANRPVEAGEKRFEPPELFSLERSAQDETRAREAVQLGEELFRAGKVGFMLVAGGQASRLGYDAPKGDYPVGPVTGRTLFAYHAQRLLAAQARYGVAPTWYVMTSPANDRATREIFAKNAYYGLSSDAVFFFQQEMMPALDTEGRVLFAAPDSLFMAPNGHGGSLLALQRSGGLAHMRERGIEQVSYFQVDNPLARPADPLFVGLHAAEDCGMSSKVVKKRGPGEKVGVIGRINGKLGCIEYSDLPEELKGARDSDGELSFRAGNIAAHMLRTSFVQELTRDRLELPWHVARKSMKAAAPDGTIHERAGFKFETFVFDALGDSRRSVTLEVERGLEFSPVKNAAGADSPATCRADLCALFAPWLAAAGEELPPVDEDGNPPVEIDPRVAETQEEFLARSDRKALRHEGGVVYEP